MLFRSGHLGYTPQSINIFGGHKAQGKTYESAVRILEDALELQKAGVFSIVLECVPYKLAALISGKLDIPVIGIGSGSGCDGQVLVTPDMLGLFRDFTPKHSKVFVQMGNAFEDATRMYIDEVRNGVFPTIENSFKIEEEVINRLEKEKTDGKLTAVR